MANEVQIEISLEEKQALEALAKLIKQTDKFTESVKESARASQSLSVAIPKVTAFVDMLGNVVGRSNDKLEDTKEVMQEVAKASVQAASKFDVFIAATAAGLAVKAFDFLADSGRKLFDVFIVQGVAAAQANEDAVNKLNTSLGLAGFNVATASKEFQKFADTLQASSNFAGNLIVENIALLSSISSLSGQGLKDGTKAALDLSAALGISLESAVRLVGKAANGETGAFEKYGIKIKEGTTNSETFANALSAVNSKLGGSAAAQVDTYSGRVTQLSNTFEKLQEEFGKLITQNDDVKDGIKILTEGIVAFSSVVVRYGPSVVSNLKEIADILIINPSKYWTEVFSGTSGLETTTQQLEGLKKEISELEILRQEASKKPFAEIYAGPDSLTGITEKLDGLIKKEQELLKLQTSLGSEGGSEFVGPSAPANLDQPNKDPASAPDVLFEQEKIALINQLKAEQEELNAADKSIKSEIEFADNESKLASIEAQIISENELKANLDATKLAQEAKTVADLDKIKADARIKNLNEEKKAGQKEIDDKKVLQKIKEQDQRDAYATIATLANSNNKSLAAIGKAAGITQIAIDTPVAIAKAYAAFPPPFNFAAAGLVGAAMAAQAARIAGIGGFQTGGFVGGNSIAGDQNVIRANSDEFVMTRAMQRNTLEAVANGAQSSGGNNNEAMAMAFSQPIIVQVDGKEIARATRQALKDGYAL